MQVALHLFNENGISDTTLRKIAMELEISQGNLNYHFRTKQALVEALYFELVEKMNARMLEMTRTAGTLENLFISCKAGMEQMFAYRFILMDFVKINMEYPTIQVHYGHLRVQRQIEFCSMLQILIQEQVLRPAEFEGEYQRWYERLNIVGDYWCNSYVIVKPEKSMHYYVHLIFESIFPYLTKKGREEYKKLQHLFKN